ELRQTLDLYKSQGMFPNSGLVLVLTAACEEDLPDLARQQILHAVLSGIERFKERGDKEALREVRRTLERKGKKPGVVASADKKRWLIELLGKLAAQPKRRFKELVPRPWKPASASARLSRFCWEFYLDCMLFGAENAEAWERPRVANLLNERHGFRFGDAQQHDHEILCAEEAYRRGKAQVPEATWP